MLRNGRFRCCPGQQHQLQQQLQNQLQLQLQPCLQQQNSTLSQRDPCLKSRMSCLDTMLIQPPQKDNIISKSLQEERQCLIKYLKNHESFNKMYKEEHNCVPHLNCEEESNCVPHLNCEEENNGVPHLNCQEENNGVPHLNSEEENNCVPHLNSEEENNCVHNLNCEEGRRLPTEYPQKVILNAKDKELVEKMKKCFVIFRMQNEMKKLACEIEPPHYQLDIFPKRKSFSSEKISVLRKKTDKKRTIMYLKKKKSNEDLKKKNSRECQMTTDFTNVFELFSKVWQYLCEMVCVVFGGSLNSEADEEEEEEEEKDEYVEKTDIKIRKSENEDEEEEEEKEEVRYMKEARKDSRTQVGTSGIKCACTSMEDTEYRSTINNCVRKYLKKACDLKECDDERNQTSKYNSKNEDTQKTSKFDSKREKEKKTSKVDSKNESEIGSKSDGRKRSRQYNSHGKTEKTRKLDFKSENTDKKMQKKKPTRRVMSTTSQQRSSSSLSI